jgi:hypothetical protein
MPEALLRDLTQEEINTFRTDGAVCARHMMPRSWIDRIATAVDRIRAAPGPFGQQLSSQAQGFTHDVYML